ncbi:shikimate dehydrogenase [Nocardioides mangrovi]|uniref:Shikimate dehydrogenase n=1 Tax=Nocardioides mangrovi TaxID=2874580 RepID=A0ABS7UK58_9ACTN|nr:shikimate dehydrogenase [Nocardioides mangrovi]MBZ5741277.1 shikimate dehydrogenase [Nocardioides mangrovi]
MRCAVLGDPIAHSLSPALHRAGYAAAGLDWTYDAVRVGDDGLADFLAGLGEEWRGLSLTMPLKRRALALGSGVTDRARLAGGANTIVLDGGRVVRADNTDYPGAAAAVREWYAGPVSAGTVLGGGATAASTGLALCDLGARRVRVLARSADRAAAAAAAIAAHPSQPQVEVAGLDAGPVDGEVVVSTIPAAAQDEQLLARCSDVPVVFEVIYDPWPTPLALAAGDRVLVSGLDLLVHQAVLQFELFTGVPGPLEAMRAAGEQVLAERHAGR